MALILERRLSKDQVLELYLNDVWLGQRGSFAVHGVAEASRLFFAKDISQRVAERSGAHRRRHPVAAAAFAVRPSRSRQGAPRRRAAGDGRGRLRQRRGRRPRRAGTRADRRPRARVGGAVLRRLHQPGAAGQVQRHREHGRRLHDARPAPAAPRAGRRARRPDARRRAARQAQAAESAGGAHRHRPAHRRDPRDGRRPLLQPVAVQPRHQRPPAARIGLQAVRLPGRVRARATRKGAPTSRRRRSSSTSRRRSRSTTSRGSRATTRASTTARSRCGARSPTRATSRRSRSPRRPATARSRRSGARSAPARRRAPTPRSRSASSKRRRSRSRRRTRCSPTAARSARCAPSRGSSSGGQDVQIRSVATKTIARRDTTFLVTNMMRSVLNEGTAAGARARPASRPTPPARPARPTTCATHGSSASRQSSLTVVWVGLDDNQPLGLSGSTAALPIWTTFMTRALAGLDSPSFQTPEGIMFVDIDRDTGQLAGPACPRVFSESFIHRHRAARNLPAARQLTVRGTQP